MTIVFVFKNGFELKMKCKEFSTGRNFLGDMTEWKADGITENKPINIDYSEVQCIYRVVSDEVAE